MEFGETKGPQGRAGGRSNPLIFAHRLILSMKVRGLP
jgi:hypothetical protein